jgi:PKD domain
MALALLIPAAAQAHVISGIVGDVATGAHVNPTGLSSHAHVTSLPMRETDLPYNGGRVLHFNRTHPIFWDPAGSGLAFDPGYEALIERFLSDVAADSHKTTNVYSLSGQYTDGSGPAAYDSTYGGAVDDTDPLPANGCTEPATGPGWTVCLTDDQLETELEHVVAADQLPATGGNIYFIITPDGFGSCTDATSTSCALGGAANGYCGYHSETPNRILYAVIPYNAVAGHCQSNNPRPNSNPADPTISTISHEHNETVTDPDGNAWIDSMGDEEADLCLTNFGPSFSAPGETPWNETINGDHYFLQEEWSNADGGCQQRARPDSLSFGSTHPDGRARLLAFTAHGSDPEGKLISFNWFFGDGRAAVGRHVSHAFRTTGSYQVRLRATDSWGNWVYSARTIRVKPRQS